MPRERRLAVNLVGVDRPVSGVERFAREIAPRLVDTEPDGFRVFFLVDERAIDRINLRDHVEPERLLIVPRLPFGAAGRHIVTQLLVPIVLLSKSVDVLFSPMDVGAVAWRRHIVMVHDLAWRHFPRAYKRSYRYLHRALTAAYRARGLTIACGTPAMAEEHTGVFTRSTIVVVPYGPGRSIVSSNGHRIARDRILWVGSRDPRKDLPTAVEACERAAVQVGRRLELLVVGRIPATQVGISNLPPTVHSTVRFVQADDNGLEELYASCRLLLYTSLYEGYGFPVAEAAARGIPVVTSPVPSALELQAGAVRIVSPHSVAAFAEAIVAELKSGHQRVAVPPARSWDDSARAVWAAVQTIATGAD